MKKKTCLLTLVILVALFGQPMALTFEKEREVSQDYIASLEAAGMIAHENEITSRLQLLMDRLSAKIDNPLYTFHINLLNDRSVNAFALPNGEIFINYGTILMAEDSDEISGVLAHEMGHCQLRHAAQRAEDAKSVNAATVAGMIVGGLATASNPAIGAALLLSSLGGNQNFALQYSREYEYQADEFGQNLITRAGLDQTAMSRFLVSMRTYSGSTVYPEFFLTHPDSENRIAALKATGGKAKPDRAFYELKATTIGMMLPFEEVKQRAGLLPKPYDKLAVGLGLIGANQSKEAINELDGIDLPLAQTYRGLALYLADRKDEALPLLKGNNRSADTALALAEIARDKGKDDEALQLLKPYGRTNARAAHDIGDIYHKRADQLQASVSYAHFYYLTQNFKACDYQLKEALKQNDKLDTQTQNDLKQMQKIVKQILKP